MEDKAYSAVVVRAEHTVDFAPEVVVDKAVMTAHHSSCCSYLARTGKPELVGKHNV